MALDSLRRGHISTFGHVLPYDQVQCTNALDLGVLNGWVWGRHNWVGYIKTHSPIKTYLINCF